MSPSADEPEIQDLTAEGRFVTWSEGVEAELVYRAEGDRLILVHTGVPDALGGRGIGGRLVTAALARARTQGLTIVPWCPFARRWLQEHARATEGVLIDWTTPPPT